LNNDVSELEALVDKIKASRKYRNTCEDTIRSCVEDALPKYRRTKDAIKAAKTKLHRIQAAYLGNVSFQDDLDTLAKSYSHRDMDEAKAICLKLMRQHASTRERIPILDRFYKEIFAVTGAPRRILDAACGIHPLSIPWMDLPDGASYWAYEIDSRLVSCLNTYFGAIGFERSQAFLKDVICTPPTETGDIAFVMKMVPCLERREKGCSIRLLETLKVRHIVVSFPIKSLSGRSKHMPSFYSQFFHDMVDGRGWEVTKLPIREELVFVVNKG
jgi:16S rRNA (guanine(1405)-N(7))-methyltransferase